MSLDDAAVYAACAAVVERMHAEVTRRYACGRCGGIILTADLDEARWRHDEQARRGLIRCTPGAPWHLEVTR